LGLKTTKGDLQRLCNQLTAEAVVKTAADEIYRVLELDEVVVRLVPPPEGDGRDGIAERSGADRSDLMRGPSETYGTGEEVGQ